MIYDANTLDTFQAFHTDFLIVGGGLAGLSLCHRLRHKGHHITLLESGGIHHTDDSAQQQFAHQLNLGYGIVSGPDEQHINIDRFLDESRYRALGGTGHLWGGKCAELDPIDFLPRAWIANSGWPIHFDELKPYFHQASELLQIPYLQTQAEGDPQHDRSPLVITGNRTITTAARCYTALAGRDNPVRYQEFIDNISQSSDIYIYLHATVTELQIHEQESRVAKVIALNYRQQKIEICPKYLILAAGGLENARLLLHNLAADERTKENISPALGHYYMSHAIHRAPNRQQQHFQFVPNVPIQQLQYYYDKRPIYSHGVFQLSSKYQRRHRLRNSSLSFQHLEPPTRPEISQHTADFAIECYFIAEQEPNYQSKLALSPHSEQRDQFGIPQINLNWQFTQSDIDVIADTVKHYETAFTAHQIGTLITSIEADQLIPTMDKTRHHMGSTRMHDDPQQGVVNRHCQVHGLDNLFIAGTSVFPTSGTANPTLAIVALTLKLGDYLNNQALT